MIKVIENSNSRNFIMWYKYDNKNYIFDDLHIHFILHNPSLFDITEVGIQDIYNHYNEPVGTEGKAREDILFLIMQDGWIRIRLRDNIWYIEVDNFTKRKNNIKRCIEYLLLTKQYMSSSDKITIYDQIRESSYFLGKVKNVFSLLESNKGEEI